MVETLTQDTFEAAIAAPGIVVVDFRAEWCGPCRGMAPQFERAARLRPRHRFAEVDVDAYPELASRYGITSIPTLVVLRDGQPVAAHQGLVRAEQLVAALDRWAGSVTAAVVGNR